MEQSSQLPNVGSSQPHHLIYVMGRGLVEILCRLLFSFKVRSYDAEIDRRPGPALIIGNHQSYLDPLIAAACFRKRQLTYVAGQFLFETPIVRNVLHLIEAIPKRQFVTDPQAVRQIIKALRQQRSVLLYPEAQRCYDGRSMSISMGIAKLALKQRCDVIVIQQKGAYFAWPRWSRGQGLRPGAIEVEARLLYKAEELAERSLEELAGQIREALAHDEFAWQQRRPKPARYRAKKRASGLNFLLYRCPDCGRVGMKSERNRLFCPHCQRSCELSPDYRFVDSTFSWQDWTLPAWHQQEIDQLQAVLQAGPASRAFADLEAEFAGTVDIAEVFADEHLGERLTGRISLAWPEVLFECDKGEKLHLSFADEENLFLTLGEYYDLYEAEKRYRIFPQDPSHTGLALDLLQAEQARRRAEA